MTDTKMINGLDPIRISAFKEKHPKFSELTDLVVSNTVYCTTTEILNKLAGLINVWKLQRKPRPLQVIMCSPHASSEHFLYQKLNHLLPPHTIVCAPTDIKSGAELLYLDDWALSGGNTCSTIKFAAKTPRIALHMTIIVALCSNEAVQNIETTFKKLSGMTYELLYDTKILRFGEYFKFVESQNEDGELEPIFYLAHLEYKIIADVYGVLRDEPDRRFMDQVEKDMEKYMPA